jgi:colicin import membrane protein
MTEPVTEFKAVITITPEIQQQVIEADSQLAIVREYHVDSLETANYVKAEGDRRKKMATQLDEIRKSITAPLRLAETNANNFFQPAIKNLLGAYDHCKGLVLTWQQQEEAKAQEAQRAAEEVARKARAEAEARAAAERAKAAEQAREATRKAQEAEAARVKALAEGNAKAAAKAAADAAKAQEQALAAVETAEAKIADREAVVVVPVAVVPTPAKIAGFSSRTVWKCRLKGLNDAERAKSKLELIRAAATDPQAAALLVFDEKSANKLAAALKSSLTIPGLEAYEEQVAASRS